MKEHQENGYRLTADQVWKGRLDGSGVLYQRWHQCVERIDLRETTDLENSLVMLGFCCDQGVRRNEGRPGAANGPAAIRQVLRNLPVHHRSSVALRDAGDVICGSEDKLENAQAQLARAVHAILIRKGIPLLLGGGHEITWGHYSGIRKSVEGRIGVINMDAHLDIRKPNEGFGSSGTGFYQIAQQCASMGEPFDYLALGIQQISNTRALFQQASDLGVEIVFAQEWQDPSNTRAIADQIKAFADRVDHVYLTIDLDVFSASVAPGVSAPAFNGIFPDHNCLQLLDILWRVPNLCALDIAELNPLFDIDCRTARLASDLIFRAVSSWV